MIAMKVAGKSGAVVCALLSFENLSRGEILFAIFWMITAIFCAVVTR